MVNYENLDNHQTGIHDYFKFLKFFGRATDIASLHIRRGRISKSRALRLLSPRVKGDYMGVSGENLTGYPASPGPRGNRV